MVIANKPELMNISLGTMLLVDAETGNIYVNPSDDVIAEIRIPQQGPRAGARPNT
jgi:phosphoenolpyruvate-protein kinase (PTS system EI component)